jgi:hypothetical protein
MADHGDHADAKRANPIDLVLRDLATRESGVEFIYSALNVLAERYDLSDVAIVLVSSSISTRVFRLHGRDVDTKAVAALGTSPGVYCLPDVVPQGELETIYSACQEAYSYRFVRSFTAEATPVAKDESRANVDAGPSRATVPYASQPEDSAPTERRVRVARREPSTRARATRQRISRLLVLVDVTILILTAAGVHGPVRLVLGLVLGIVIPGWCLVAPLKLDNAPLELGLVLTVSLSLLMMVAQILMTMNLWHLVALEEVTSAVCLPFLLQQSKLASWWSPLSNGSTRSHNKVPSAS